MKYLLFTFSTVGFLIACSPKTTEIITDVQTEEVDVTSSDPNMPKSDIGEGKVVFLENCISCHYGRSTENVPALVDSYSKEEWSTILPKMIQQAELDDEKSRQVSAYIYWELEN